MVLYYTLVPYEEVGWCRRPTKRQRMSINPFLGGGFRAPILFDALEDLDKAVFEQKSKNENCCTKNEENKISFQAKLTGFKPSHISVKFANDAIVVDAIRDEISEDDGMKTRLKKEFHKSYKIPSGVNPEDVRCSFNNEELKISVPILPPKYAEAIDIPVSTKTEENKDAINEEEQQSENKEVQKNEKKEEK